MQHVFKGTVTFVREDSGKALIATIEGKSEHLFVRLQSWDEWAKHEEANQLRGKKIRVTVEEVRAMRPTMDDPMAPKPPMTLPTGWWREFRLAAVSSLGYVDGGPVTIAMDLLSSYWHYEKGVTAVQMTNGQTHYLLLSYADFDRIAHGNEPAKEGML